MREKFFTSLVATLALVALAAAGAHTARAQDPEQDEGISVRGAFITTRPTAKTEERKEGGSQSAGRSSAKSSAATGRSGAAVAAAGGPGRQGARSKGASKSAGGQEVAATKKLGAVDGPTPEVKIVTAGGSKPEGIGIGYTLFKRDELNGAVRVSPKREFKSGDAIRLVLETNIDGYLYIFDAENDRLPKLIFPNAKLNGGSNAIRAHVPYQIPSGKEGGGSSPWFIFDNTPALERLYVIVSRQPLEGVPTGEELVSFCAEQPNCAWTPGAAQWASIKGASANEQIAMSRVSDEGRAQTVVEREAATRGLGLSTEAPLPSIIYMITSSNANVLVTTVDLVHR